MLLRQYWYASRETYGLEKKENNCKTFKKVELSSKQILQWQFLQIAYARCSAASAVEDAENHYLQKSLTNVSDCKETEHNKLYI